MSATKPTLVIIPGGWHVPETYEKLITALEKEGYEVHCPRLPSTNQVCFNSARSSHARSL